MISFFQNTLNVMTMCYGTQGILWIMGKLQQARYVEKRRPHQGLDNKR